MRTDPADLFRHPSERDIERALVERVSAAGGIAYKFTSPSRRSVPDRIVLMPGRAAQFVELKAPGAKPTKAQLREHARIAAAGGKVWVIDDIDGVEHFLECMQ